jgi:predicted Zn-dependent peptidase
MKNIAWQRRVLPNGIRLLLYPRMSSMTAQLSIAVAYGSNSDPEKTAGMAHFLEHMTAGGSEKQIQRSRSIELMGGYIDFSTGNEDTMIVSDVMPDKLCKASQTFSELLFDCTFEEEKLRSERKIILHEIAEAEDDPWNVVDELMRKNLFKNHPVKRPVLGFRKTVSKLSLDEVDKMHQINYVPQNIVLILSGNFSDKAAENVAENFGYAKNESMISNNKVPVENSKSKEESRKSKTGISQTYLSLGARVVSSRHPDMPALNVIDTLLGVGASSRLFIELREKKALAYSIESAYEYGLDYGYFHIDCAIESKRLEETKCLLHKEVEKLRNEKVLDEELNKVKDMIAGTILRTVDSPVDFPEVMAVMEMHFNSENALQEYLEDVKALSANDILEVANKYLTEEKISTAVLYPKT